ncbi:hypothetical protein [Hydrogenobaculum acidophilum]
MDCEEVSYEFRNDFIVYSYKNFENVLGLNIFMWFTVNDGYLGVYEKKDLNVDFIVGKDGIIEIVFKDDKSSCCYKGYCKNISELFEFLESVSDYWGFGGLF